jgi:hypothetical protein
MYYAYKKVREIYSTLTASRETCRHGFRGALKQ